MIKKLVTLSTIIGFGLATPATALAATLQLDPSGGKLIQGCSVSLKINLNTAGAETDGTDAILNYDPTRLTIDKTDITAGTIYPDYPGNNVDATTGKITISGLASVSQGFTGSGILATINVKIPQTAPTGAASIKFDFDPSNPSKTTDSNVVERNTIKDVLNSVSDSNFTIGTGTCADQTVTAASGSSGNLSSTGSKGGTGTDNTAALQKKLPSGGTEQFTFMAAILGGTLTVLGILGFALL